MAGNFWQSGSISPQLLTSNLQRAYTIPALLEIYTAHESSLNHIHLSACWRSLGHLAKTAGWNWYQENSYALESLVRHTTKTVSAGEVPARQLASIAHGVAWTGRGQDINNLMQALARAIKLRLAECNVQELANAVWAFAKVGHLDSQLFAAFASMAEGRAGNFNAQELANVVWAFATAGHSDERLFLALAGAVEYRLGDFTAQGLANTAWAFAKAGHLDKTLSSVMARAIERRIHDFNAQDLAHTAWSFAKAGHADAQLLPVLARSVEKCLGKFSSQGLANTAWAFAKAGHLDAQLFSALARSIETCLGDFNAQDLANTAWAFAKACHLDVQLFTELAKSIGRRMDDFNAQDLVNTAWAFAKVGQADAHLFKALAKSIKRCLGDLGARHLADVAWAFAKADQFEEKLFTALARASEGLLGDFNAQDIANTAWAFANAGHLDEQLFAALARLVESGQHRGDFSDEELDNTAWAFAKAGNQGLAKSLRQRKDPEVNTGLAPADVSKCGRIVVAGGGLAGAAIAVALQSKGFDVVVLEADDSFDSRKQGYGLTIQALDAMQALGINVAQDDAPATSHYTFSSHGDILGVFGEAFREGKDRRAPSTNTGRFLHIPRQTFRARILERVRPGTIRWSSRLKSFSCWHEGDGADRGGKRRRAVDDEEQSDRRKSGVHVTLTDGTTIDAALLVGADGIHSTVRQKLGLPGDRLNYLGLIVVLGMMPTAEPSNGHSKSGKHKGNEDNGALKGKAGVEAATTAFPLPQRRIFETVDGVTRIYAMPFTTSETMWQLSFPCTEEAARTLAKDPAALKAEILDRCGKWHEPVPALLRGTPLDCMSGYPVYDRDPLDPEVLRAPQAASKEAKDFTPGPQRRVTIIGDAAHPMCPFRAQGANQAVSDAVLLAESLEAGVRKHGPCAGLDVALPLFERKMLSRSARIVLASRDKAKELHSSLSLQPARKVQRETGVDMPAMLKILRSRGIGAHTASDPRGLDVVVAEVIDVTSLGESSSALQDAPRDEAAEDRKRRRVE